MYPLFIHFDSKRKEGRTEGRKAENYVPPLFFEKAGDKKLVFPNVIPSVYYI